MSSSSGLDVPLEEGELSDVDEEQTFGRELEDGEVASDEEESLDESSRGDFTVASKVSERPASGSPKIIWEELYETVSEASDQLLSREFEVDEVGSEGLMVVDKPCSDLSANLEHAEPVRNDYLNQLCGWTNEAVGQPTHSESWTFSISPLPETIEFCEHLPSVIQRVSELNVASLKEFTFSSRIRFAHDHSLIVSLLSALCHQAPLLQSISLNCRLNAGSDLGALRDFLRHLPPQLEKFELGGLFYKDAEIRNGHILKRKCEDLFTDEILPFLLALTETPVALRAFVAHSTICLSADYDWNPEQRSIYSRQLAAAQTLSERADCAWPFVLKRMELNVPSSQLDIAITRKEDSAVVHEIILGIDVVSDPYEEAVMHFVAADMEQQIDDCPPPLNELPRNESLPLPSDEQPLPGPAVTNNRWGSLSKNAKRYKRQKRKIKALSLANNEQLLPGPAVTKRLPENANRMKEQKHKIEAIFGIVAECPAKRQRSTVEENLLQQKVQDLPLLCVEAICKFTPTSKLARLYSNAVPLPGAYWHSRVEATLEKRAPFSLAYAALFDATGAQVVSLKNSEAFRFSPLCGLIKSATMKLVGSEKRGKVALYILHGDAILSCLPMLTELSLVMERLNKRTMRKEDLLLPNLKHLLPRLESFSVDTSSGPQTTLLDAALADVFKREIHLHEIPNLRRLSLPERAFGGVQETATNCTAESNALSKLSSLGIWQPGASLFCISLRFEMLQFLAHSCRQLSALFLLVVGDFKLYLATFRALAGLRTLGLRLDDVDTNELTFNDSDTIPSVTDLRLIFSPHLEYSNVLAVAELFPNAKAVALQCSERNWDSLVLATELCTRQVLPKLEQLRCFLAGEASACSNERLTQLLTNSNLPEAVDLSETVFENIPRKAGLLVRIYSAMQSNATKFLLLRGPVHREALAILQSHIHLNEPSAKITTTKNRDLDCQLPESPGISQEGDMIIIGRKTAGRIKGDQFVIRIVHQLTNRTDIFG